MINCLTNPSAEDFAQFEGGGDEWIGGSILSSGTHESSHTQTGLLPLL